ncbi:MULTISPECIES: DUF2188 domain-containing protein [unclassified Mesorhizobium]|uniref:DUF2188 domain-containing protein n=1 Tax=unclassified Mesorhizobium TaxID=325217 RepID=UPI000F75F0FE|nr:MULTISPECIES: DUF2188 domain-containing protein [unclassified Mesorhizobium]AZO68715.1 DUF2188 domain-containing protein [Mesorhizobium sp. M6A.T.Cr.TU.016.01.1.1]RWP56939.1 MAG: DUF2188 domain-containing protein [Mesorhizobium sp.]RWQ85572.1 MAG: DUF2188 domain-containing protein [Mesorhizobium sp.]
MAKNYWTTKRGDGWAVKKEGASRASSVHSTQAEAWSETRRLARGAQSEALLQGADGKIRSRNSYGSDPNPPKG